MRPGLADENPVRAPSLTTGAADTVGQAGRQTLPHTTAVSKRTRHHDRTDAPPQDRRSTCHMAAALAGDQRDDRHPSPSPPIARSPRTGADEPVKDAPGVRLGAPSGPITPSPLANRSELPPSATDFRKRPRLSAYRTNPPPRPAPATSTSYNRTTLVQHHGTGSVTLDTTWSAPLKPPTSIKTNQPWILLALVPHPQGPGRPPTTPPGPTPNKAEQIPPGDSRPHPSLLAPLPTPLLHSHPPSTP